MIVAVELVKDKIKKTPFSYKEDIGMKIYKRGLKEGIILRPLGNVIYLWLPLSIKKNELDIILSKTYKALNIPNIG